MNTKEPTSKEKRRHPRIDSLNLISYMNTEEGVQQNPISMGRTLDISRSGIQLEAFHGMAVGSRMEMEIAIKDDLFNVSGEVIHSHAINARKWLLGIRFDTDQADLLDKL